MKKNKLEITASTKLTMIFCGCVTVFSTVLLIFLMFFPLKMENPSNGINEKLIASAQSTIDTTTSSISTTITTYVNTRLTTDKNRTHTTTLDEVVEYDDSSYDYNDDYNDYDHSYNDYDYGYSYPDEPVYTQAPEPEPVITDIPDVPDVPDISDAE